MEFHIKADDEDAAGSNQLGIAVSRPSRARQLTKKGRKYQAEFVLEKKTKAMIAEKGQSNRRSSLLSNQPCCSETRTWTVFRYFQTVIILYFKRSTVS